MTSRTLTGALVVLATIVQLGWAYELIETNYGDECTKLSYTCAEFEACCSNRTRYSTKSRFNCVEAYSDRLMIYECVGSIRRRPSVPQTLQDACRYSVDHSTTCIREAYGCWDFKQCCRSKAGIGAHMYCNEIHKDLIDDFLCCEAAQGYGVSGLGYASHSPSHSPLHRLLLLLLLLPLRRLLASP